MTESAPANLPEAGTNITPLRGQNVIAVASGKGGVGKTWFSITLCHALTKHGRKILLFDGDLGLANVDIQLGWAPQRDLGTVIEGQSSLQSAAETFPGGGFDILAGRSGSGSLANMPSQRLNELRTELLTVARRYDSVVIDLGAGIDRATRHLAGPAATTLVIVTNEPTSITDAYAFIKVTRATNPTADIRIIVNMADSQRDGNETYETVSKACNKFLGFSPALAGIIRRDTHVRDAIRSQTPLLVRSPTCEAAADVEAIVAKLLNTPPSG